MKTLEFIKLLQELDPSGECHIRIDGIMPQYVERKEGYQDGPYSYMEDETLVFSTEEDKIDIYTFDIEEWAWENYDSWEDKIKFRFDYVDSSSKIAEIKSKISKAANEAKEYDKKFNTRIF